MSTTVRRTRGACVVGLLAAILLGRSIPSHASGLEAQPALCRGSETDETTRPLPASLVPAVTRAFGLRMAPTDIERQTVIRCDHGAVLACMTGANLNCGPADSRTSNVGGDSWCRAHPNASFVPMFATGHATIYTWRCAGTHAVTARQARTQDAGGFVAGNWKRLRG